MDSVELAGLKVALRQEATARRERAYAANPAAGEILRLQFDQALALPPGAAVSGYWPLEGEMDVRPLLYHLHAMGHPVGLPVVKAKGEPLFFRAWLPGADLVKGNFGVHTPKPDAPELVPQFLIVPLLAFDPAGYRLGYGGGFYDRTLAQLRTTSAHSVAIGVAYADQEVSLVPRGLYDQPLDWVITERAVYRFS